MNDQSTEKQSWWQRLSGGLKRTSASIGGAVTDLVAKRRLDQAMLDEIEEVLIRADLGVETAAKIAAAVGEGPHPGGQAALDRRTKAFRRARRRGQRLGQDHHNRQTRRQVPRRGPFGDARCRRYL